MISTTSNDLTPPGPLQQDQVSQSGLLMEEPRAKSPESFYAQIAEQGCSPDQTVIYDTNQMAFLGEAFSLTYVVHDVLAPSLAGSIPFPHKLHFPVNHGSPVVSRVEVIQKQTEHLHVHGLWFRPPLHIVDALIDTFQDQFNPAFPILQHGRLQSLLRREECSLLLLNSVLMIAISICHDDLLATFDGLTRHDVRRLCYRQAKAVFDADLEPDKLDTITGIFLMSFWWEKPDDQQDSWHWLGIATSLAQSLGIHRSYVSVSCNVLDMFH